MRPPSSARLAGMQGSEEVLELSEEHVVVARRRVEGDTVRVATNTQTRPHLVEEEVARESIEVEHVPIGRVVEVSPGLRQEGDVTILPVMEEVLVLERRLVLKEEIRIRRVRTTEMHRETVQLRAQVATVTRSKAETVANPQGPQPQSINKESETP